MGTINYGTSYRFFENEANKAPRRIWEKDITIGLKPMSYFSDKESGYNEWLEEEKSENPDFEESDMERSEYDQMMDEEDLSNIKCFLDNHENLPEHYEISIVNGYYEGFYLNIEDDIPWVFDDSEEKKEYLKDITRLKKVLLELLDNGLCVVYPGWCTDFADKKNSVKEIMTFVKNLREEVKAVDTFAVYKKKEAVA